MFQFILLIIAVVFSYLSPFFLLYGMISDGAYDGFPWNLERTFLDNIFSWLFLLLPAWMLYAIHKTFGSVIRSIFGGIPDHYTEKADGYVLSIEDSGVRINGKSLKEAKVSYLGKEKLFTDLPSSFISFFRSGNRVVVRYDPENSDNSEIDIEASKLIDQSTAEAETEDLSLLQATPVDAYLKVSSIDFRPDAGAKAFEIKGVVQGGSLNGNEVTVITDLESSQVGSVTIGRLLPVVVSDNSVADKIKFAEGAF